VGLVALEESVGLAELAVPEELVVSVESEGQAVLVGLVESEAPVGWAALAELEGLVV
jgi:hypothetical protein